MHIQNLRELHWKNELKGLAASHCSVLYRIDVIQKRAPESERQRWADEYRTSDCNWWVPGRPAFYDRCRCWRQSVGYGVDRLWDEIRWEDGMVLLHLLTDDRICSELHLMHAVRSPCSSYANMAAPKTVYRHCCFFCYKSASCEPVSEIFGSNARVSVRFLPRDAL